MKRELKRLLEHHKTALKTQSQDFYSIFTTMFSYRENILCEGNDGIRTYRYTFGEMEDRIRLAASSLYGRIGATHGYVALEMENGPDWVVAFWAILMSGNKPYLVNMRYPSSLTEHILKTLDIRYGICQGESRLSVEQIPVSSLVDGSTVPENVFENEIAFSSSATSMNEVICFYSGKEVVEQILDFEGIIKINPRMAKHYKGQLKQLAFLPFYHIFGLFAVYFWFSFFGRTLVFLQDYSADTILKTVRKHGVTHIFAVPMLWHTIEKQVLAAAAEQGPKQEKKLRNGIKAMTALQNVFPNFGCFVAKNVMKQVTEKLFGPSVMFCISGGSYLRDSALELLNGLGYSLHNGFGMSEVAITSVELRKKVKHMNENAIGLPFDSVEYKIENGELLIRGTSVCTHKLVNGVDMKMEGWFHTGDLAEYRNGQYFLLGRKGDVVIGENGENVNPDTVEKFFALPGAAAFSVLGLPGEDGEELSMVVQVHPYAPVRKKQQLREEIYGINGTLPMASRIRKFYFTTQEMIPPTAVKVSRTQLKKKIETGAVTLIPFSDLSDAEADALTEETVLMQEVKAVVAKVMGIDQNTVTATTHVIYDLGATSIQYFSMLAALQRKFNITDYNKSDSYRYTVQEMTKYIEEHL